MTKWWSWNHKTFLAAPNLKILFKSYEFLQNNFREGLFQLAAIKVHLHHHRHKMLNEPIRAKQVNQSSSVIGWQNRGQAGTSECTLAQCTMCTQMYRSKTDPSKVCALIVWVTSVHFSENWAKQSACTHDNLKFRQTLLGAKQAVAFAVSAKEFAIFFFTNTLWIYSSFSLLLLLGGISKLSPYKGSLLLHVQTRCLWRNKINWSEQGQCAGAKWTIN